MKFDIVVSEDKKYLICRISVPITTAIALEYAKEMDGISRQTGIKLFLYDVRGIPNISTITENYKLAHVDIPDIQFQRDSCSAILIDADDRSHDFVETVFRNAGYNVRIFIHKGQAIEWLKQHADSGEINIPANSRSPAEISY